MYKAIGDQIFIHGELFLTVHKTDSSISQCRQAAIIAELLNEKCSSPVLDKKGDLRDSDYTTK